MYNNLKNLIKKKDLVALYTNVSNGNAFSVGYIRALVQEGVLLQSVGIHGEYDGYIAINVKDILRIETNSKYLEKIKKLISFNINEKETEMCSEDAFIFLIKNAMDNNKIVAVQYADDCEVRGYVKDIKEVLSIVEVDEYGYEEGENIIELANINRVVVDDVECRDIEKLYRANYQDKGTVLLS